MYNQRANNIILYCNSFENLKEFDLESENEIINLKNIPFFDKDCNIIFNSLTHFKFSENSKYVMNIDILNNLYNNIDKNKFPNLTEFNVLSSFNQGNMFYKKFIGKIISINSIRKINIQRTTNKCNENFSRKELKVLFPNACLYKLKEVNIEKYKESFINFMKGRLIKCK